MFGFGFAWWMLRWTVALVFFIGIMVASGYYVFNEAVAGGKYVTVPEIVGHPLQQAGDIVLREGLRMGETNYAQADNYPENYVIHQNPAAGKVVRAERKVYATVSREDRETVVTPNLIGKSVPDAIAMLEAAELHPGAAIARIANAAPADTVIGHDPPADAAVPRGTEVRLLVSEGIATKTLKVFMPDLMGLSPEEAQAELAPLNVTARPFTIKGTAPPFDVVFDQNPEPGILLEPGHVVTYRIRVNPEDETEMRPTDAWREVTVAYVIPPFWMEREVRMDVIYQNGRRETAFPQLRDYVDGLPPKYPPGTTIKQPIPFQDEVTVEVFLDGEKARSYYYKGDADPIIRDFGSASGETSSAGA